MSITFDQDYQLCVGNQTLELPYKGENHVEGNMFIYAPTQKVLMLVDMVFPGWIPLSNLGEVKNVPGYIKAHDQILSYDFVHFVGGHLDRSGVRQDVTLQQEYIHDLYNNCAYTINLTTTANKVLGAESLLPPVLAKNLGNSWTEFETDLEATAGYCANLTNKKWLQRLAGSDVFQFSNAETMIDSLRLDYGILGAFKLTWAKETVQLECGLWNMFCYNKRYLSMISRDHNLQLFMKSICQLRIVHIVFKHNRWKEDSSYLVE